MSNTKFTKGPWAHSSFTVRGSEGKVIADCGFSYELHDTEKANADLIAAAPDMYHYLDELKNKMVGNKAIEYKNEIEQLLKKARGE
jgi:hypothetical protein